MQIHRAVLRRMSLSLLNRRLPTHYVPKVGKSSILRSQLRAASSATDWSKSSSFSSFGVSPALGIGGTAAAAAALALLTTASAYSSTSTEAKAPAEPHPGAHPMPAAVSEDDICDNAPSLEELPVYRSSQVAQNDGSDGKPIWMSYGGVVYDVTGFIPNHPGGSEKILQASGGVRNYDITKQTHSCQIQLNLPLWKLFFSFLV